MVDTRIFFFEENASNICDHVYSSYTILLPLPPFLPPSQVMNFSFRASNLQNHSTSIPLPLPSWLQSGEMKRETFLHDPEKHCPLSSTPSSALSSPRREEESAMLSRNVTRSTSPRFGIFMRRFVYWISLLVYRVKLEIGIRGWVGSRFLLKDYWSRYRAVRKDCWFLLIGVILDLWMYRWKLWNYIMGERREGVRKDFRIFFKDLLMKFRWFVN